VPVCYQLLVLAIFGRSFRSRIIFRRSFGDFRRIVFLRTTLDALPIALMSHSKVSLLSAVFLFSFGAALTKRLLSCAAAKWRRLYSVSDDRRWRLNEEVGR
jgi:hypothetical protein